MHFVNNPAEQSAGDRRRVLDTLQQLNQRQLADAGDPEIATRINPYEWVQRSADLNRM